MKNIDNLFNRAINLHKAGDLFTARELYKQILEAFPVHTKTLNLLGASFIQSGEHQKGLPFIERALLLQPDFLEAHNNLGIILKALNRYDEAIECYRNSLALKPNYALAHYNLGIALNELKRHKEAVVSYHNALAIKSDYPEAHNNLGISLKELKRYEAAIACFQNALTLKPDYADAYCNLGNALKEIKQHEKAISLYQTALKIVPDSADAYSGIGYALSELCRHDEAAACFRKAVAIKPHSAFIMGMYIHSKAHSCDWNEFENMSRALLNHIDAGRKAANPFQLLPLPSSLAQQKLCSEIWAKEKCPELPGSSTFHKKYFHDKIRLGYFSADFYNHATAYLIAELIEKQDRSKFQIFGFSLGISPNDNMHQRVSASFDRFIDVSAISDQDIASLARDFEIDIAIDLKGYTTDARTGIFSFRPAPIQVNYLGYPGTMGAPYIDYLIADPLLIPDEHQLYYSEKIAYLPDSYQPNDSNKQISDRQFTRKEVGLPEQGFVFCCFNNNYKITPLVFGIWMQLLKNVEGSVLWLFEGNAQAGQNLRDEAAILGIAPERLIFAQRMDLPDHLARHRLADLFLDTFFCNAHTTASDALWAGLPVLTCLGDTFAGRVAGSLLNAIGLPELVAHSHEEYKSLALDLATTPEKLSALRLQLKSNRITHPLFDTIKYTRHLESAFTQMWIRHQDSLSPDHIYVRKIYD